VVVHASTPTILAVLVSSKAVFSRFRSDREKGRIEMSYGWVWLILGGAQRDITLAVELSLKTGP